MELTQYLQELEQVVNIDCGTGSVEGVEQVYQHFQQWYQQDGWHCQRVELDDKVARACWSPTNLMQSIMMFYWWGIWIPFFLWERWLHVLSLLRAIAPEARRGGHERGIADHSLGITWAESR